MRLDEKYRPKNFDEVIGQDKAVSTLKKILEIKGNFGGLSFRIGVQQF
jgi:DNA polymerase III gamma/tau subunit